MSGSVTIIVGPMFASKSTELIRRLDRALLAKKETMLFKPQIDNRYSDTSVVSHDGLSFPATVVASYKDIYDEVPETVEVVGFDEIQFFDAEVWRVVDALAADGKDVFVAGLSTDFMGNPFETTARVAMIADAVKKLTAVCVPCGADAVWTQLVVDGTEITDGDRIQVGGTEAYEPRCRNCFIRGRVHENVR